MHGTPRTMANRKGPDLVLVAVGGESFIFVYESKLVLDSLLVSKSCLQVLCTSYWWEFAVPTLLLSKHRTAWLALACLFSSLTQVNAGHAQQFDRPWH
jgi:hypothetical protein